MVGSNGSQYDVIVSDGDLANLNGTVGLNLSSVHNITDLAGNFLPNKEPDSDDTFAVDNTAPTVTLTAPSLTSQTMPSVTINATDGVSGMPDGMQTLLDVDLNNDGDYTDPGESSHTTATLSGSTATFAISPPLVQATYRLRARVSDVAGNEGASADSTLIVDIGIIAGGAGRDTIHIVACAGDATKAHVFVNSDPNYSVSLTEISQFTVIGDTGDDQLVVDFSHTATPCPRAGLSSTAEPIRRVTAS